MEVCQTVGLTARFVSGYVATQHWHDSVSRSQLLEEAAEAMKLDPIHHHLHAWPEVLARSLFAGSGMAGV
ncbi:MAG: hypothetical protein ACUVRV_03310 [Cyanobacteriota bacterium]